MTINLRPYQSELIDQSRAAFYQHRRVLVVAPTGAGKTVIFCSIALRVIGKGKRVYLIAHRIEIVEQIGAALRRLGVPFGWIAPGHPYQPQQVMVAMVQSLSRRATSIPAPDLLVVDEAHHATAGTYQAVMAAWASAYVLGVTASPARTDGRGLGDCFDYMILGPSMRELITRGYLAPFKYFAPPVSANFDGLAVRGGDFARDQIAKVMDTSTITGDAIQHYRKRLDGRPAIAFCSSVEHAEHVAAQFCASGYRAASVDGAMKLNERTDRIKAIGDGRLNVLTSCDVISEGTDIPSVSGAILLRPTMSLIVHLQQCGRVLRPKEDGSHAIILDHVGNALRAGMGMPDAPREWSLTPGKASRPAAPTVRQCPECFAAFHPARACPECGYVFPVENARKAKKEVAGDLVEVGGSTVERYQHWLANGPLKDVMKGRHTLEQIEEVRKARGYHHQWSGHQLKYRGRHAA